MQQENQFPFQTVFITGAAGFIGSNLAKQLLERHPGI